MYIYIYAKAYLHTVFDVCRWFVDHEYPSCCSVFAEATNGTSKSSEVFTGIEGASGHHATFIQQNRPWKITQWLDLSWNVVLCSPQHESFFARLYGYIALQEGFGMPMLSVNHEQSLVCHLIWNWNMMNLAHGSEGGRPQKHQRGVFRREWWQHQAVKPWVFSEATLVDKNVAMTMTRYDKMTRYPRPGKIASALCRDDHPINEPSHMHLTTCLLSGYANCTAEHSCLCCCFLLLVLVVTMSAVETGWKCERMCLHDVCNAAKGAHTHRGRGMIMKPLQSAKSSQIMRGKTKQELASCNYAVGERIIL